LIKAGGFCYFSSLWGVFHIKYFLRILKKRKSVREISRDMVVNKKEKVVVAMSGGVDSSVALAVLKEQGYDCIGITMQLWDYSEDTEKAAGAVAGGCCSLEDVNDARRVAYSLDVPFYVLNMQDIFEKEVVDYFTEAYLKGKTPNPCIKCNDILKFSALMKKARALGADKLATGHYARIKYINGRPRLFKGADKTKDQSYFLFTMTEAQLERTLFPLGGLTKSEVREKARALGLRVSEKKESQEICFVEGGTYREFMTARAGGPALTSFGEIWDGGGNIIGRHKGLFNYTIGQRKGLGLQGGPFYVTKIDVANNRLVVGPVDELYSAGLRARGLTWIGGGEEAVGAKGLTARIRYSPDEVPCRITSNSGGDITVEFSAPQKAVTPGQAVVFYRAEEVLGGAWIEEAIG